jgi:hypothetical protein
VTRPAHGETLFSFKTELPNTVDPRRAEKGNPRIVPLGILRLCIKNHVKPQNQVATDNCYRTLLGKHLNFYTKPEFYCTFVPSFKTPI